MVDAEQSLKLRPSNVSDADKVGTIIFNAFSTIAQRHGFTSDFPSIDIAKDATSSLLSNPNFIQLLLKKIVMLLV